MKKTTWFAGRFPGYVSQLSSVALWLLAALSSRTSHVETYFNHACCSVDISVVAGFRALYNAYLTPPGSL
ncbi:hypothetical protein, partial [Salmonella enterica]|uniref:hypothetical protein n=1 Tax=Salmonella enterica TaxID=28901 RepID=UPI00398C651F